jgi:hypothetical protein
MFFESQKSVLGYEYVDKNFIRERTPSAAKETIKFDERTLQAALREIIAVSDMFASEQQPNLSREKVIDFYNSYGPLTGDIETWKLKGGPVEETSA